MTSHEIARQLKGKFTFGDADNRGDDHRWFELTLPDVPTVKVKVSHGNAEPGPTLVSKMAKQARVPSSFFKKMIECTRSKEQYYAVLRGAPAS